MTIDEAQAIATIIGTADNGCSVCVRNLVTQMQLRFPEFEWTIGKRIEEHFLYSSLPNMPPIPADKENSDYSVNRVIITVTTW